MRLSLRHRLVIVAGFFMYPLVAFFTLLVLADVNVPAPYRFWDAAPVITNSWDHFPLVQPAPPPQTPPVIPPGMKRVTDPALLQELNAAAREAPTSNERAPLPMPLWLRCSIAALISWGIAAALIYPIAWVIDAARPPRRPGGKAPT